MAGVDINIHYNIQSVFLTLLQQALADLLSSKMKSIIELFFSFVTIIQLCTLVQAATPIANPPLVSVYYLVRSLEYTNIGRTVLMMISTTLFKCESMERRPA